MPKPSAPAPVAPDPRTMTDSALAALLRAKLPTLANGEASFAASLMAGFDRWRSFTAKQRPHVISVLFPEAKPAVTPRPGLSGVIDLFDKAAASGLKHPRVWLRLRCGQDIRLSRAGSGARQPGTVNVTDGGGYETGQWFGRIARDGAFNPSPRIAEPPTLFAALAYLAAHPAATAAIHGQRTGTCCYCARALEDARSVAKGYGPICADKWGLPWGDDTSVQSEPKRVTLGRKRKPIISPAVREIAAREEAERLSRKA